MSVSVEKAGAGLGTGCLRSVMLTDTGIGQAQRVDCFLLWKEEECSGENEDLLSDGDLLHSANPLPGDSGRLCNLLSQPSWLPQFNRNLNGVTRDESGPLGNLELGSEQQKDPNEAVEDGGG